MKNKLSALVIMATTTLAACGGPETAGTENSATSPAQSANASAEAGPAADQIHSGDGQITEIAENKVTISHGPIAAIDWPAMTMAFAAPSPDMLQGLAVGDKVSFQFQQSGSDYVITSINKAQ